MRGSITLIVLALVLGACESTTDPEVLSTSVAAAPLIQANPTAIHLCYPFTAGSTRCCCFPSQTLRITNAGGGTLAWAATKNRRWFRIRPREGTAPTTVTVSVNDLTGTVVGVTYRGSITISGAGASNSPLRVPVTLWRWR
jgi:hypothetical protein